LIKLLFSNFEVQLSNGLLMPALSCFILFMKVDD